MRIILATTIFFFANQLLADELTFQCTVQPDGVKGGELVVEPHEREINYAFWPTSNSKVGEWTEDYVVWTSRSEELFIHALFLFNRNTSRLLIETIRFEHSVKDPDTYIPPPQDFQYLKCSRNEKAF